MRQTLRLALVLLFLAALQSSVFGGGTKCPPRIGVIARQGEALSGTVVFIDSADNRTYQLNTTEEAMFHVGHRVRIVAHVIPETTNTLFVHSFTCLRAHESR